MNLLNHPDGTAFAHILQIQKHIADILWYALVFNIMILNIYFYLFFNLLNENGYEKLRKLGSMFKLAWQNYVPQN